MRELLPNLLAQYIVPPSSAKRDATGAPKPALGPARNLWVRELTGFTTMTESTTGGATRALFTARFLTRYDASLRPEGILDVADRRFEITGITPAPKSPFRRWVHLHCVQKRA